MLTQLHLSLTDQLRALRCFLTLTQNPATFEAIYDLDEILRRTDLSAIAMQHLHSQPEVAMLMAERYLAPVPDLNVLITYPQDSLGYQFAFHLLANQFDPEFYRKREVVDDISYITLRRSQTHDIQHVITGFGTDTSGELGLQAFQLAQMRSPIAIAIITAGILNAFADAALLTAHMRQIVRGWEMGLTAKPLIAQKWEDAWEKPVSQWRTELGIESNAMLLAPAMVAA